MTKKEDRQPKVSGKHGQAPPPHWRRIKMDPGRKYNAGFKHTIDLGEPFVDALLVPVAGGSVALVDYSRAGEGKLLVTFKSTFTRLRAVHLHGGQS